LPAIANRNWFGRVALNDPEGTRFEETSSREGLIQNEAFAALVDALRALLVHTVLRCATARGKKGKASDEGAATRPYVGLAREVRKEVAQLAALASRTRNAPLKAQAARTVAAVERLEETSRVDEAAAVRVLKEIEMLRVLAAMGILVGEVVHEVRPWIGVIEESVGTLGQATSPDVIAASERMTGGLRRLRSVLGYVERVYADQASRETKLHEIRDVLREFKLIVDDDAQRSGIELTLVELETDAIFSPAMHDAEWGAVLFNLYTNAKKAIRRGGVESRIRLSCGRSGRELFVECADTGVGIPDDDRDRVFDTFFTTTRPNVTDGEVSVGLGLGLSITRDIVLGYEGRIAVVDPPDGFRTAIRLWLPETPPSEVPESAY
jgi:signal transduction histidine kinase